MEEDTTMKEGEYTVLLDGCAHQAIADRFRDNNVYYSRNFLAI
jgi:hypothetical protein